MKNIRLFEQFNPKEEPKDVAFFDVMFGLVHAVKENMIDETELNKILDSIKSNRVTIEDLAKIIGEKSSDLIPFILNKMK